MFNSCKFNTVKYNSTCLLQPIIPEVEIGGGIHVRQRKYKVSQKQFFDIVGIKLLFKYQLFNIFGFILLAKKYGYSINAQYLFQLEKEFSLEGQNKYPLELEKELVGFIKFLKEEKVDITSFKLFLAQQDYELNGVKLSEEIFLKAIEGQKAIYSEQFNAIYGKKDIRNILEALDLLDLDE